MKKKTILLGLLPVSMLLLSFVDSTAVSKVTRLNNGNFILQNVNLTEADVAKFQYLEEEYQPTYDALGFFWSCYTKDQNKFQHGRIWGGGCCTSAPSSSSVNYAYEDEVRSTINEMMQKYMN